jgi:hypothetical protein
MDQSRVNKVSHRPTSGRKPDASGLLLALELMELGIELAQQRIARLNPDISHAELVAKTNEWIRSPRNEIRSSITV